jgi:GNAT superfamily N-acetyltransferase
LTQAEQKEHWYVFIMGTAEDRRRQGLAGTLLEQMQGLARSDGRPLWLEATTAYSRDLYLKHGFTAVGEAGLGKGTVGADGLPAKGGDGVTIWGMVWRP